jgi:5'-3' exonuclease
MQFRLYLAAAFIGSVVGVLVFYPLYDFVYFHENGVENMTAFDYISGRFVESLQGHTPIKTWFIAKVGIVFGVVLAWVYGKLHKKLAQIEQLTAELQRDLKASIQDKLKNSEEQITLSKQLLTLKQDIPLGFNLKDIRLNHKNNPSKSKIPMGEVHALR